MIFWGRVAAILREHGAAALVSVHEVQGSAPREAGARMIVRPDGAFHGTIGGGQLEWQMLAAAREALSRGSGPALFLDQVLGPDLGQCCGGRVKVLLETFDGQDLAAVEELARSEGEGEIQIAARLQEDGRIARSFPLLSAGEGGERSEPGEGPSARSTPVALSRPAAGGTLSRGGERVWRENYGERRTSLLLFGAGHVGRALVLSLAPLPFAVRWIDSREGAFPSHFPSYVEALRAPDPVGEVARAPTHAFVVVMTHDHPLDLAVAAAALERDFPFVGLIGSATKRARFEKRFRELGIPEERIRALACPIGLPDIRGKEPAVIAASATAQLLAERERLASGKASPPVRLARSGGRR